MTVQCRQRNSIFNLPNRKRWGISGSQMDGIGIAPGPWRSSNELWTSTDIKTTHYHRHGCHNATVGAASEARLGFIFIISFFCSRSVSHCLPHSRHLSFSFLLLFFLISPPSHSQRKMDGVRPSTCHAAPRPDMRSLTRPWTTSVTLHHK